MTALPTKSPASPPWAGASRPPAAVPTKAQQFDFYKYLRIFWRRKWLLIIPLAICLPLCLALAAWLPIQYESRAILEMQLNLPKVEQGVRRINVMQELSTVQNRMLGWTAVRDIVLSRKVDFGRDIDPDDRRNLERLYHEVRRATSIRPLGIKHLQVSHRSTSPERNATLVNELVKKYVGEDRKMAQDQAKVDMEYYRQKLDAAQSKLAEGDNDIRDFALKNPWLRDDLSELHRDLKDAEEELAAVQQQIVELEAARDEFRKELAKTPAEITVTEEVEPSEELKAALKHLEAMQGFFNEISANFRPAHRRFQDAKRRLEEAQARVAALDTGDRVREETRDNPRYTELQQELQAAEKRLEKANARKIDHDKKVSDLFVKTRKAPELIAEKKRLEGQRAGVQEVVAELGKHFRAAEKEFQRLSTEAYSSKFKVFEYARPDETPVKSTKIKVVALGILVGLMTGVGLVVLIEYLDQTFKTIDDARDYLGIPALGVIPAIFTPRDHRRRLWFRVLAVSSAVFVAGVAVTLYLAVPGVHAFIHNDAWMWFKDLVRGW